MLNKKVLVTLLAALAMALLLVGPVLAQDVEPLQEGCVEPPTATEGLYVTTEDNVGNGGTGPADRDMGYAAGFCVYNYEARHPIEFNIVVDDVPASDGDLGLAVCDVDLSEGEVDQLFLNGHLVDAEMPESGGECVELHYSIPAGWIQQGNNLVQINVDVNNPVEGEFCALVCWGSLAVMEPEFVPELGSIVLLAGGLMGVAGYAGLRLRKR